jgi:hypothetical protein
MTQHPRRLADFRLYKAVLGPSAALIAVACWMLAFGVAPAAATFHLMMVREVYPGSAANPEAQFVELQMWQGGQNLVGGHVLRSYDASGKVTAANSFPANVPNSANQSTLLLATPQAEAQFGVVADAPLAPALSPTGGAVCWEAIDCVSWGNFSGEAASPTGTPAAPAGIPDGMALRRSLARGCPTFLDFEDDHDNSAADFEAVFPKPRPNSVPPTETACAAEGPGGGSGSPSGQNPPQTFLRKKPPQRTSDRTPTFRFAADETGVRFECRLDRKKFHRCRSPFTAPKLSLGRHRFQVRARDGEGKVDPTPASFRFRVVSRG